MITGKCWLVSFDGDDGVSRILTDFLGEIRVGEELFGLVESLLERKLEKLEADFFEFFVVAKEGGLIIVFFNFNYLDWFQRQNLVSF